MKINANYILRQEVKTPLKVGQKYPFKKEGLHFIVDDIQIWLTSKDWTPLAEIQVTSQTRKDNQTTGTFVVKHVYTKTEQSALKAIFLRMYGWS